MSQHFLSYSDAKSDKFWNITLHGCSHTVQYGRLGTSGQTQTKEFATEEEAQRSLEKLVREKLKKGYRDMGSGGPGEQGGEKVEVEVEVEEVSDLGEVEAVSWGYPAGRSLHLAPEDWFWATWRDLVPLQRPEPLPFNRKDALARLAKVTGGQYGWQWNWEKARIAPALTREEAHFWLTAMTQVNSQMPPKKLAEQLANQEFSGEVSFEDWCETLFQPAHANLAHILVIQQLSINVYLPLINLFSKTQLIDLLLFVENQICNIQKHNAWTLQEVRSSLTRGFQKYIIPYLTNIERRDLQKMVGEQLDLSQWPTDYYATPSPIFYLAAYLGCPALHTLVESWDDKLYCQSGWRHDFYHRPQEIIFGLGNADWVEAHMQRLKLSLQLPDHSNESAIYLRAWLAHTEYRALDLVRDSALEITNKQEAQFFNQAFAQLVQAPEATPVMLELMTSKAPQVARQWLEENPAQAIAGLVPIAAERGKLADAAIDFLCVMKRKGYATYIQTCIEQEAAEVAAKIQTAVLNVAGNEYPPLDKQSTPAWLQQALATPLKKPSKVVWAIGPEALPPITLGEHRFQDAHVEALLNALAQSKLDAPHPLVVAIKTHIDRPVREAFTWKLFESWLQEGAPSKANWALIAVGLLGSDTCALKLAPLIRLWPGESQHQRAVMGLECLRTIGTDTALMQINGIAQKVKFKGIKQRAQECMEAIAQDRQMTREQLEDRIVPTCDLNEQGSRRFDFGPRQFHFVLGPDLKPMVKDAAGKVKTDLPKPNSKDDQDMAEEAIAQWKLLKKQISEVVKLQPLRLEQAMVTGRRWHIDEFKTLLVQHPVMTHLVQRLIWGSYDQGKLISTFRVTEDQTYANAKDETLELVEELQVGIAHPLHITTDELATWGELLSDYEIAQPFVQLGRSLYTLNPEERDAYEITRFQNLQIPIVTLVRTIENLGWQRGMLHDHGDYSLHFKYFSSTDITAVVGEYENVFVDLSFTLGSGMDSIKRCCFLKGLHKHLYDYPGQAWMQSVNAQRLPLGQVDPIIISEVLKDLSAIAAKAQ